MRILILSPFVSPAARHGTELVAQDLAVNWAALGHTVTISGHIVKNTIFEQPSIEAGISVHPLPALPAGDRVSQFTRRSSALPGFQDLLRAAAPHVAVIVGFGPDSITLSHVEALAERGVPVTLWHHVPSITCQQHGLRHKNRVPCDGAVLPQRCTACRLTAAGAPDFVAEVASRARLPLATARLPGPIGHLLGGRALSAAFARSIELLGTNVAHVFVGADWVQKVMERNGFASEKITRIRPGLRNAFADAIEATPNCNSPDAPLRLAYWGRIDDTKGIDTAIRAVRSLRGDLTLDIIGEYDLNHPYHRYLTALAADDPRIAFVGRLEARELACRLRQVDAAVLASTWLETGPLTVYEAHAAGLPILGSNYGGIGEICRDDPSARLFERGDDAALAALINELVVDRSKASHRRTLVPTPRTMKDVAIEMQKTLAAIIHSPK